MSGWNVGDVNNGLEFASIRIPPRSRRAVLSGETGSESGQLGPRKHGETIGQKLKVSFHRAEPTCSPWEPGEPGTSPPFFPPSGHGCRLTVSKAPPSTSHGRGPGLVLCVVGSCSWPFSGLNAETLWWPIVSCGPWLCVLGKLRPLPLSCVLCLLQVLKHEFPCFSPPFIPNMLF